MHARYVSIWDSLGKPPGVCGYGPNGDPIGPHDETGQGRCGCEPLDPFAAPTVKAVEPTRVKPGSNGEWIWLDRGRYSAPCPLTGERRTWQRATNFIRALDDGYALARWSEARVAYGLSRRPGLLAHAAALTLADEDRAELASVVEQAKEAAGASDAAELGTAMHKWTERYDRKQLRPGDMPDDVLTDVAAYGGALANAGLEVWPEYIERTVCLPELGVMGTFDRLLCSRISSRLCELCPDDVLFVGDLKTGLNELTYGQVKAAQQFALYAYASHVVSEARDGWEPMPRVCPHVGVMMHLPVGSGQCTLYRVDLVRGWAFVEESLRVIEVRRVKNLVTPWENA